MIWLPTALAREVTIVDTDRLGVHRHCQERPVLFASAFENGLADYKSTFKSLNGNVRPLLIIGVERDYLRGAIVWSHL